MLQPQQPPPFLRTAPLAVRGELCSNLSNYKSQIESRQQHLALYGLPSTFSSYHDRSD